MLRCADIDELCIAECTAPSPALVSALIDDAFGPRLGIEIRKRREPGYAAEPVAVLAAALGVEEVVGEGPCVALREPERTDPRVSLHAADTRTSRRRRAAGARRVRAARGGARAGTRPR